MVGGTAASYLGTKIQLLKIESEHYSLNIPQFSVFVFHFSKPTKSSHKVEKSMALSDILSGYTSVSLYSWYHLCSRSVHVEQKTVTCAQENMSCQQNKYFSSHIVHQNHVSHKKYVAATTKNYVTPEREAHVD